MDNRSQNSSGLISTKKNFVVKKDVIKQPEIADYKLTKESEIDQTTSSSTLSHSNGTTNQNKSPNQNYSSRNSLRASQYKPHTDRGPPIHRSGPVDNNDMLKPPKFIDNYLERHVDDNSNYELLNSEVFLGNIGNDLVCMLCGIKKQLQTEPVEQHLTSEDHQSNYFKLREILLNQVPKRTSLQMQSIIQLLSMWFDQQSLTSEMIVTRFDIINNFRSLLQTVNPECQLRIFGSLMTGTSLISSDINLELIHPNSKLFEKDPRAKNSIHHKLIDPDADFGSQINNHVLHYDLIPNAIETLYTVMKIVSQDQYTPQFKVISDLNDLNRKVPRLILNHLPTGINLEVCCYAGASFKLSVFLNSYLSLDKRARELCLLVRYWAQLCSIDKPDHGTFSPDAFIILTIYYLQRVSPPVLPCLHEILSKGSKSEATNGAKEDSIVKELNNLDLSGSDVTRFRTEPEHNNVSKLITDTIEGCIEQGEEELEDEEDEDSDCMEFSQDDVENINWTSTNDSNVPELFIDFLLFMMEEFNNLKNVISIRTLKAVPLDSKSWVTQVKPIENPLKPNINISRCIGTIRTFEYIRNCFKYCYYYLTSTPLDSSLKQKQQIKADPSDYSDLYINLKRFYEYCKMRIPTMRSTPSYDAIREMENQNIFGKDVLVINALFDIAAAEHYETQLLPQMFANSFKKSLLLPLDVQSTTYCGMCKRIGHKRLDCPKAKLENLQRESELFDEELDNKVNFDKIFCCMYKQEAITPRHSTIHNDVVDSLERIINEKTELNCRLQLFGSTVNSLGSFYCDLDICMTLVDNRTGKGVDYVEVLERVYNVLEGVNHVKKMERIFSARVPILKFKYKRFEIDLSMYNQCAIFNSELVKSYSMIDDRVGQLFYLVKKYARGCGIADASKGSLSSYAWSLMVIHYLQRTNPPILPVLQETSLPSEKQMIGISGWNVWFRTDAPQPQEPNNTSLTRLFKEFFLYYGNFDFNFYVVSVRKSCLITRFQKNWNHCMMAIEDPFELTYNLASRLDDQMATYIINSFSQAYRHIVRIQEHHLKTYGQSETPKSSSVDRIFYGRGITGTEPPYRGCRNCHRIGHKYKDCPDKKERPRRF